MLLVVSSGTLTYLKRDGRDTLDRSGSYPSLTTYEELPVYVCFFVLVGVVGLMHTSVLGSSLESVIAVPMWLTRVLSFAVFSILIALMGQGINPGLVFRVVFPLLIAVLTLLPFLGAPVNQLTGFVSITCYNICGMMFYLFNIREGRRFDLSSVLVTSVYMIGSSGTLLVGLLAGILLRSLSASFDLSLLTMLAFVAIYPLVLVLVFLSRKGRLIKAGDGASASVDEVEKIEKPDHIVEMPSLGSDLSVLAEVAHEHGLTRREREVLGYLASGRSVKYIAETLVISENTAWTHTKRIYAKTGTHGKQELLDLIQAAAKRGPTA